MRSFEFGIKQCYCNVIFEKYILFKLCSRISQKSNMKAKFGLIIGLTIPKYNIIAIVNRRTVIKVIPLHSIFDI